MTSKHHKWQLRWRIDRAAGLATHDTGLRVRFAGSVARGQAENAPDVAAELGKTHGPHNTPKMLERLIREAERLFAGH
jgi:hypothetical protein